MVDWDRTTECDYCWRYPKRYVVRSDDELAEVCARHLASTVDRLAAGQETYLTVAPLAGAGIADPTASAP